MLKISKVETFGAELQNNTWILESAGHVVIIDAAFQAGPILAAIPKNSIVDAILITHGHFDHTTVAPELAEHTGNVPVYLHPKDQFLWEDKHAAKTTTALRDGMKIICGNDEIIVLHTPGHTPGSTSFYTDGELFSGDTLFPGGPGATQFEYSDFQQIIASLHNKLFTLPDNTTVHPGHGADTTLGEEKPHLNEWSARGW